MGGMSREEAARALGMKTREVTDWDGEVAVLLDGTRFTVHADGSYEQLRGMRPDSSAPAEGDVTEQPASGDEDEVPDGSAAKVLGWVGDDPVRARLALQAEQKDKRRVGLLTELEKLAAG